MRAFPVCYLRWRDVREIQVMALIYIVEDDSGIREVETIALKNSGHKIQAYEKAADFYRGLKSLKPDLVLLDIMLPDEDGYTILQRLREDPATRRLPIIMVTAKTTELDMIQGLESGADDYIRKPFSVMELISRVKALLRRTQEEEIEEMQVGGVRMDHSRRLVWSGEHPVELTFKEYALLRCLMMNAEKAVPRERILRFVWDTDFEGESRTVDMHIKTLRQKLGENGRQIRTVRNVGYMIQASVEVTE